MAVVTKEFLSLSLFLFIRKKTMPIMGLVSGAIFNFDLERYELTITSDCGSYAYGWVPTPRSENFMHLMARLESGYLLDKLADPCVVDTEATFSAVKRLMGRLWR